MKLVFSFGKILPRMKQMVMRDTIQIYCFFLLEYKRIIFSKHLCTDDIIYELSYIFQGVPSGRFV